jgi:hypothetical protein
VERAGAGGAPISLLLPDEPVLIILLQELTEDIVLVRVFVITDTSSFRSMKLAI